MTKEELLELVNKKEDTSKFKSLSQRTIDEELVEALEEIGDDESANDKVVTKLANRLKRMNGNLHSNVAAEVKKAKEEAERKKKEEEEKKKLEGTGGGGENQNQSEDYKALLARVEKMEQDAKEREAKAAKNAVLASVKEGLKTKFGEAKIELNNFFADIALGKLEIGEEPDVTSLVAKAESIYTADMKAAGFDPKGKPRDTNGGGGGEDHVDEHEFDDIAARLKD